MVALTLASPAQTRRFARVLARLLHPPALVTIEGDLGTGKTTLVREIMRARGVRGVVTSLRSPWRRVITAAGVRPSITSTCIG
jgi:tRNA A37 threonylcarbamoyladenosine biosynthesis protein TsaE